LDTQLIPIVDLPRENSGGDGDAAGIVLRKLPAILTYSVKHTAGHVEVLRSFAGRTYPQILKILSYSMATNVQVAAFIYVCKKEIKI